MNAAQRARRALELKSLEYKKRLANKENIPEDEIKELDRLIKLYKTEYMRKNAKEIK